MTRRALLSLLLLVLAPALRAQSISWSINDVDIKDRLLTLLVERPLSTEDRAYLESFNPNDSVVVVFRVQRDTLEGLAEVRLTGINDRRRIRDPQIAALPPAFLDTLLQRRYAWGRTFELGSVPLPVITAAGTSGDAPTAQTTLALDDNFWFTPTVAEFALPTRITARVQPTTGVFLEMGAPEFGLTAGALSSLRAGLIHGGIKVFALFPILSPWEVHLESPLGAGFALSTGSFGGVVQFGELPSYITSLNEKMKRREDIGYLNGAMQVYYSRDLSLGAGGQVRLHVGASALAVSQARWIMEDDMAITRRFFYGGGLLRLMWLSAPGRSGIPTLALLAQSILGNHSRLTVSAVFNFSRMIGLEVGTTYALLNDDARLWSREFTPTGSLRIRL